jgi:hypothetical protein
MKTIKPISSHKRSITTEYRTEVLQINQRMLAVREFTNNKCVSTFIYPQEDVTVYKKGTVKIKKDARAYMYVGDKTLKRFETKPFYQATDIDDGYMPDEFNPEAGGKPVPMRNIVDLERSRVGRDAKNKVQHGLQEDMNGQMFLMKEAVERALSVKESDVDGLHFESRGFMNE